MHEEKILAKKSLFDPEKAKLAIEKGRRSKWWLRKGPPSRGFKYFDLSGLEIKSEDSIARIRALAIPPAWKSVRISPSASSKLQAVGIDASGRVQYLYHAKFSESQQRKKFAKIEKFGEYVPLLRKVTNEHILLEGFPREKVLAIMVRLINSLYMRMGTEKSVKNYKTYGITTLQNRHLEIRSKRELIFQFVGKSSVKHRKILADEELAVLMADLKRLGASRKLFHYIDDEGKPRAVRPGDINHYLKSNTAPEFSAKDFRTWGATLLAAVELAELGKADDDHQLKKNIDRAVKLAAKQLGNTPTVCRGSYIHPMVLKAYAGGVILEDFRPRKTRHKRRIEAELEPEEQSLLKLFREFGGLRK